MDLLLLPVFIFGLFYILWIFYLAVMNLQRVRDLGLLHPVVKKLAYPILIVGVLLNILLNITILTILFLDVPREWTISKRLNRYMTQPVANWRSKAAKIFEYLLDPFDPDGDHI
jgi:hypothetical protein